MLYRAKEKLLHARTRENFCANFVPLAYEIRPYCGISPNMLSLLSYLYYYSYLLQSIPVYPVHLSSNQQVRASSPCWCASYTKGLQRFAFYVIPKMCLFCAIQFKKLHSFLREPPLILHSQTPTTTFPNSCKTNRLMLYIAFATTKQLQQKFPTLFSILDAFYNEMVFIDKKHNKA